MAPRLNQAMGLKYNKESAAKQAAAPKNVAPTTGNE